MLMRSMKHPCVRWVLILSKADLTTESPMKNTINLIYSTYYILLVLSEIHHDLHEAYMILKDIPDIRYGDQIYKMFLIMSQEH